MPLATARNGSRVRTDPDLPSSTVEMVSPQMADKWLSAGDVNYRRLRETRVERYMGILARNEWELTNDAITWSKNGQLVNGQHRLEAIRRSNRTVPLLVLRGVAARAQDVMDSGLSRSFADRLRAEGYVNVHVLGSAVNFTYQLDWIEKAEARREKKGGDVALHYSPGEGPTVPVLLKLLKRNPGILDAIKLATTWVQSMKCRPGSTAACIYRFMQLDPELAAEFVETVASGANLEDQDPRLLLRNALFDDARKKGGRRLPAYRVAALICKAWNYWIDQQKPGTLAYKFSPVYKEPFPIPYIRS